MRPMLLGMKTRGRVDHRFLVRTSAVTREMITLERKTAVEARGPHLSLLPRTEWVGIGLAPPTVIALIIRIDGVTMTGNPVRTIMVGTKTIGLVTMSAPNGVDQVGENPTLIRKSVLKFANKSTVAVVVIVGCY